MKYLLDTHVLLWTIFDDEKLSETARKIIKDQDNKVYASIISYWEISLKYALGKLELVGITPDELPKHVQKADINTLGVNKKIVSTFYKLPKIKHKDPFDRMIIWQAISNKITLISRELLGMIHNLIRMIRVLQAFAS